MPKIWITALIAILLVGCSALPNAKTLHSGLEDNEMNKDPEILAPDSEETPPAADAQPGELLFDFQPGTPAWSSVDDSVMGGISRSTSRVTEQGHLEFAGTMSLENNGGFASIRSPWNPIDLSGYDGLVIRVLGDGQTYRLRIRSSETGPELAYNSLFETTAGEWVTVYLPFETMIPTWRGFRAPAGKLDPQSITSLGLMLSDKQPGDFSLQVDWIRAVSEGEILTRLLPTIEA